MKNKPIVHCDRCGKSVSMDELKTITVNDYFYEDISYDYVDVCNDCYENLKQWLLDGGINNE